MIFRPLKLDGAFLIEPERLIDDRGFFARTWCKREFEDRGLNNSIAQCNLGFNKHRGTLRGMHYQVAPHTEAKLVRCTMGAIYDVIIDLRKKSSTYTEWLAVELTAENRKMLYIPENLAHGYQTLTDNTEVFYQVSEFYDPEYERGLRWDDPIIEIKWPEETPVLISIKDRNWPDFFYES